MSAGRWATVAVIAMGACRPADQTPSGAGKADTTAARADRIADRVARYSTVRLTADLAPLSARERQMIPLLIDAAREMDTIYWRETYGNRDSLLASLADPSLRRFAEINYGPWDRL